MPKMGKAFRENYGNCSLPTGREYRIRHLEAMAREEKKFNEQFGTKDMRYQNQLKRVRKPKPKRRQSSSIFSGDF